MEVVASECRTWKLVEMVSVEGDVCRSVSGTLVKMVEVEWLIHVVEKRGSVVAIRSHAGEVVLELHGVRQGLHVIGTGEEVAGVYSRLVCCAVVLPCVVLLLVDEVLAFPNVVVVAVE